ncbi:hypothetical protein FRB96_008544 [Tulasnella sp. 330]|nr:hypothetical protein FRB96_008544 [Tulasnella sp. 330]KAG8871343.1 hypothetical protein FRB98_000832 [Tulasnella sp. 332]KAG8871782.1 hypothetical protein FRB97_008320 [Tulasnella sp. 331]
MELEVNTNYHRVGSFFKAILLYDENGQKVKGFFEDLDWAMKFFLVASQLEGSAVFRAQLDASVARISVLTSSGLPPSPGHLFGRDNAVKEITSRLASELARFSILGSEGVRKTSVTLQVLGHHRPVNPGRIERGGQFVPGLLKRTWSHYFDNFETPWKVAEEQARIRDVLSIVTLHHHVSVLITMTSKSPPRVWIPWTLPRLAQLLALLNEANHRLYMEVHPDAKGDEKLDDLLFNLNGQPIAIILMAKLGIRAGKPTELLKMWN